MGVLIIGVFITATAAAADNPSGYYLRNEHTFEQDVEGEGFAMVYQKVNTKTLQLKNFMRGSGTLDAATLIYSNQSSKSGATQDRNTLAYLPSQRSDSGFISFVEQNEMTYAPVAMAYGTGWYERNPIIYNSKLKERTEAKSYQVGASMVHQIEYASAFVKDIGVDLECVEPWPPSGYYSTEKRDGYGLARMKIEEQVTDGVVHIGQLLTDPSSREHGWKNPLIEIDENYHGTFRITKNMEIYVKKSASAPRGDWLSCCFGGYDSIHADDKMGLEKEVFDSTCRDVAWGKAWEDKSKEQPL
ncbi:hypothetical protein [Candidatus Methanocrinis natronophilus]|uniref:Uncharacterized protein n=1 Tax=Candidatus Methanocrinis natronophilus TaxID=3033396 RepID=A0ABT5X950_9EURY|nr:hypothetical protein [Candidatus Methanocrinis natronophilus]MDF0591217.1 hypothetical protein [Candidatus Methanocrinis natronophilus]